VLVVNLCNQQRQNCAELVADGDISSAKHNDKDPGDKKVYVEQYSFIHVRAVLKFQRISHAFML
jgi:hypothetical protein